MTKYNMFTTSKERVRKFDKDIIKLFFEKSGKKIGYFGLPGENILDILAWRPYLKSVVGVENDRDRATQLMHNVLQNGIGDIFRRLRGDIDDILLNGADVDGRELVYPFELINLDYQGGLIFKTKEGYSRRVDALRKLFENQEKESKKDIKFDEFLLFITVTTRHKIKNEYSQFLKDLGKKLDGEKNSAALNQIKQKNQEYIITKFYLPCLIRDIASGAHYDCHVYEPVTYKGSGDVRLLHFTFRLRYVRGIDANISHKQTHLKALNLKLNEVIVKNNKAILQTSLEKIPKFH